MAVHCSRISDSCRGEVWQQMSGKYVIVTFLHCVREPGVWWFLPLCSQVNGALAVSIMTTVISLTAAILHGLDTAGILSYCSHYSCYQYMVCYFSWLKPQFLWFHISPTHLYRGTDSILRIRMLKSILKKYYKILKMNAVYLNFKYELFTIFGICFCNMMQHNINRTNYI